MLCSEKLFNNEMSKHNLTDSSLILHIYFSSMQYIDMTSKPAYTAMALMSDIGGALGLLLGATLLTLYELAEFIAQLGHYAARTRRRPIQRANTNYSPQTTTAT